MREVWLQHTESQRAGAEPIHKRYSQRPVGAVAVAEREGADKTHNETEGGIEKGEERGGNRPQRQCDCATLRMCDEPHRPTHRHHEYVPQPQVYHPLDDARQRP